MSKDGTCCGCGYAGEEETPCSGRDDNMHCPHWWEGPDTPVTGKCCACGLFTDEETACPEREDHVHCIHWCENASPKQRCEPPNHRSSQFESEEEKRYWALSTEQRAKLPPEALPGGWY